MFHCKGESLPTSVGKLVNLVKIDLQGNNLCGNYFYCNVSFNITLAYLIYILYSGSIPDCFGSLIKLNYLDLCGNQLTGTIAVVYLLYN